MADFKVVWNFSDVQGGSWSETYYRSSGDLNAAANFPEALLDARLKMLSPVHELKTARVSSVLNNRVAVPVTLNRKGSAAPAVISTVGQAAVLNLVSTAVPSSRRLWLRGWPQSAFLRNQETGKIDVQVGMTTALKDFFKALKDASFQIYPLQRPGVGGIAVHDITKLDGHSEPGYSIITLTAAPTFVAGDRVIIGKTDKTKVPKLNGRYRVVSVSGVTFKIQYDASRYEEDLALTGTARKEAYATGAIIDDTKCGLSHVRTRDTKNPSSRSRGSKPAGTRRR